MTDEKEAAKGVERSETFSERNLVLTFPQHSYKPFLPSKPLVSEGNLLLTPFLSLDLQIAKKYTMAMLSNRREIARFEIADRQRNCNPISPAKLQTKLQLRSQ